MLLLAVIIYRRRNSATALAAIGEIASPVWPSEHTCGDLAARASPEKTIYSRRRLGELPARNPGRPERLLGLHLT